MDWCKFKKVPSCFPVRCKYTKFDYTLATVSRLAFAQMWFFIFSAIISTHVLKPTKLLMLNSISSCFISQLHNISCPYSSSIFKTSPVYSLDARLGGEIIDQQTISSIRPIYNKRPRKVLKFQMDQHVLTLLEVVGH